jgi:Na+/serine symporter
MTNVRLAPFFLLAAVVACGAPALAPGSASRVPLATAAADTQEISLEISALM